MTHVFQFTVIFISGAFFYIESEASNINASDKVSLQKDAHIYKVLRKRHFRIFASDKGLRQCCGLSLILSNTSTKSYIMERAVANGIQLTPYIRINSILSADN